MPTETIADMQLQPYPPVEGPGKGIPRTIYWASSLMTFQEKPAQAKLLPKCDPEVEKQMVAIEEQCTAAAAKARKDARAHFWALPQTPWPSDLDATKTRFYWSHENEYQMGESITLELLPEEAGFRQYEHSWSDNGNHTSHRHVLIKGTYRLVRAEASGARAAVYEIRRMPSHKWASHHPPIAWTDTAAFSHIPADQADLLTSMLLDADGVWLGSKRLVHWKG